MTHNPMYEYGVAVVLVALFVALFNPFNLWMPDMLHMTLLGLGVVVFGAYATFVVREQAMDERDGLHRMYSGRAAFLAGAGALVAGITYQSYQGQVDVWLVFVLVLMVLTKIGAHLYNDRMH